MAAPVKITAILERQARREIELAFSSRGHLQLTEDELGISVSDWRSVVRKVGRSIGRPVKTFHFDGVVIAQLDDWPADEREANLHREARRRNVEGASLPAPSEQ